MDMILGRAAASAIAVAFALGVAGAPAQAQEQARLAVPYADLDLGHPMGMQSLDRRLVRAAKQICGQPGPVLREIMNARTCQSQTLVQARAQARQLQAIMVAQRGNRDVGG